MIFLKICRMSCSHSPQPTCISRRNYIPVHVKMKYGALYDSLVEIKWPLHVITSDAPYHKPTTLIQPSLPKSLTSYTQKIGPVSLHKIIAHTDILLNDKANKFTELGVKQHNIDIQFSIHLEHAAPIWHFLIEMCQKKRHLLIELIQHLQYP
jgi:hypothetical protein